MTKKLPISTIVFEDFGTIKAEFYPYIAQNTVNLSNNGFTFHRIIKNLMIQN